MVQSDFPISVLICDSWVEMLIIKAELLRLCISLLEVWKRVLWFLEPRTLIALVDIVSRPLWSNWKCASLLDCIGREILFPRSTALV